MKRIISRANASMSIGMAATIISGSFLLSSLLGLLRERLLAARFGIDNGILDAYWAAFSLPDLLYFFLVSGALSVTFIPVLKKRLVEGKRREAWELASNTINFLSVITLICSVLIFIFADPLVHLIAGGFDQPRHDLAVSLMRIIAINPFIFTISTVLGAMQQSVNRFFFFALAPVLYNIGIIFGIITLSPHLGIVGVALGVAIGAILQLMLTIVGMVGMGFQYTWVLDMKNKGFREVVKHLIPRSLDQGMDNVNATIERLIASFLAVGSITAFQYAYVLRNVPVVLIGVAISTAAFPSITERAASTRTDLFRQEVQNVIKTIIWFALPATAIAFLMRGYLIRLLIGNGNALISDLLGWFAISIVFRAIFHAVSRAFYAQQDTKTPLFISIVAVSLNIFLAYYLALPLDLGVIGLAIAQSFIAVFEVGLLVLVLQGRLGGIVTRKFVFEGVKMTIATLVMSIATYLLVSRVFPLLAGDTGFFTLAPKFVGMVVVSAGVYLVASYYVGLEEAKIVFRELNRRIFAPIRPSKL